jgi:hypothetical protein
MKSRLQHLVQRIGNGLRPALLVLALIGLTVSITANAQETWRVDPQHSVARLYFGRGSQAFEIGVVRITGDVNFDSKDPGDSTVRLGLQPDDRSRADYAEISLTSKQSTTRSDGKLSVTGNLFVTRVKRSVTMEPNEAYHGPEYGGPVAYTDTREITLVFSNPGRGAVHYEIMQLSGAISVSREDFPQLVDALVIGDWPAILMDDEKCEASSTVGEDYSGVNCTGTEIASVNNPVIPTGGTGGEGYYGFEPAVTPDHNYASITLDVKLNQTSAASQVVSGAAPSAANQ